MAPARLGVTPGWDGDEGYNLDIAWHLLHGRAQVFALDYAFVQHPVLGYALLAPLLGPVRAPSCGSARALAPSPAPSPAGALYLAVALSGARRAAVLAALARPARTSPSPTAGWPTPTACCCCGRRYAAGRCRWESPAAGGGACALAAGCAALGLLTDQVGVALPLFVAARALPRRAAAALVLGPASLPALLAAGGRRRPPRRGR